MKLVFLTLTACLFTVISKLGPTPQTPKSGPVTGPAPIARIQNQ